MKKYEVTAILTTHLITEIEAVDYDEALRIAERELITADFDVVTGDFNLSKVMEINK
jgi:hypothetical protein